MGVWYQHVSSIAPFGFSNDGSRKRCTSLRLGRWLFNPEVVDGISRDIVHLAQMARRTGQDPDDAALKEYEIREKRRDIKGKEIHSNTYRLIYFRHF